MAAENKFPILLNGEEHLTKAVTAAALVAEQNLDQEGVVVLMNGEVLPRDSWETNLKEGDEMELLRFVSGG